MSVTNISTSSFKCESLWNHNLNPDQFLTVTSPPGKTLVVSGPGSGKTRVITCRILYIIKELGIPPWRILAMTFTNKAAGEMKKRLENSLGREIQGIFIGTFHSICTRLLRAYPEEAQVPKNFTIIDEDDQIKILGKIVKELKISSSSFKPSILKSKIERVKRSSLFVDESDKDSVFFRIFKSYEQYLKEHNFLDFSDLILYATTMLKKNNELRKNISSKFIHVLVDEFQDTDIAQYQMIKYLSEVHGNLFVVGDDDQSIYGWRGARVENMLDFIDDFPECMVFKLEKNYRSTARILKVASSVINENKKRTSKNLWTDASAGEPVQIIECWNEKEEAKAVVKKIIEFCKKGGKRSECVVIYRIHAQSRALEEAFVEQNIPYRVIGGIRFYERMEIKDILSYIRIVSNPADDTSFLRIVNVPARGIGKSAIEKIEEIAKNRSVSMLSAAKIAIEEKLLPENNIKALSQLEKILERAGSFLLKKKPSILLDEILKLTSYQDYIKEKYADTAETRLQNIDELRSYFQLLEEEEPDITIAMVLDRIATQTSVDMMNEEDRVTLMTAHSAKGLEFDFVCITGVESGLFPYESWNSYMESEAKRKREIEEDRRLLYVAMTRAKKNLVITWARARHSGFLRGFGTISPFLDFIPKSDVVVMEYHDIEKSGKSKSKDMAHHAKTTSSEHSTKSKRNGIKTGDIVFHRKFGKGKVIAIEQGTVNKVTVKFETGKTKQIVETFLERNLE